MLGPGAERQLIDRARSGSVDAFDSLMRAHQDPLFRFLVVRGLSRADAEDVVQEAFLAAYRHLSSYRSRWRFSTWLFTIARRIAGRSRPPVAEPTEAETQSTPEEQAARAEEKANLWNVARRTLSREQCSALWLYYAEELETAEVARVLGRPRTWVKVNLHRSRQRLAEALDEPSVTARNLNDEPLRT